MNNKEQNEIANSYFNGSDLRDREEVVLYDASQRTGFIPRELVGRSSWWGSSQIGAFHYIGEYNGKKAVLKIQGVKPNLSEISMIEAFATSNRSRRIRPPYLYASISWDEEKRYEALILEYIDNVKVISVPSDEKQIEYFFECYDDYRKYCLGSPWLDKPIQTIAQRIKNNFSKWSKATHEIYPQHPLREVADSDLIDQAVAVILLGYQDVDVNFLHGHFSTEDLYKVDDQVVVLSNLYWSWRQPFYDAVFGYHWFMYALSSVSDISPHQVEAQRSLWLKYIKQIPKTDTDKKLLNLALLERASAGLLMDSLVAKPITSITKHLVQETRNQIKYLIEEIK